MLSPLLIRRGNFNLTSKILKQFIKLNHTKSVQDLKFTSELYPNLKRLPFATIQAEDLKFFENELGKSRVITDQDEVINFSTDWMKMFKGSSPVVLKPKTTDEISKILNYCNKRKIAVCPQGGNTGLVGGSVPVFDEVILNMSLMNQIIKMDDISGVLECQAGCVLENLEKYANEYGFIVPIDLGAKGSCQIGGNVSTNAGGLRFLRYGSLHGNVLGLEIVLANGEILDCMNSMKKDNTGYDLKQLFIGAEGTLGVVTKVSIQCPPTPKSISLAFLGTTSFENVLKTFKTAKEMLSEVLSSFELMDSESIEPVERFYNLKPPISPNNFYMLIETSGSNEKHDEEKLSAFLEHLLSKGYIEDGTLAASPTHAKSFWQLRESIAAALQLEGSVYKYDISLPLKYFYEIVPLMKDHLKHTKILTCCGFGHVGDCNLHLNMTKAGPHDTTLINDIESFLYKYIMEKGGSISAEHGIGFRKRDALIEYKSRTSLNSFWAVREHVPVAHFESGYAYKYDVSLPLKEFYNLVLAMRERLVNVDASCVGYGHIGDNNLHLTVTAPQFDSTTKSIIDPFIFEYTSKNRGSVSGEHGIGIMNRDALKFSKNKSVIESMKNVKGLLDPHGILNPYKVFM